MGGIVSFLYRLAQTANTVDAVAHPRRLRRRAKNILVGRVMGRMGVWRWLWQ